MPERILRSHLPEYACEALGLALAMAAAGAVAVALNRPGSPLHALIPDPLARRCMAAVVTGCVVVANVYSPWGRRSGAHYNPATTLTYWRLGRVAGRDALGYVVAQFVGAFAGAGIAALLLRAAYLDPPVMALVTRPGPAGTVVAFAAESVLAFVLFSVVLEATNSPRAARYTGLIVGLVIAVYIAAASPLSGMSLNPARSLGSAAFGRGRADLWIYFAAPPLGMLAAAQVFVRRKGRHAVWCAKMLHDARPCIFCEHRQARRINGGGGVTDRPAPHPNSGSALRLVEAET